MNLGKDSSGQLPRINEPNGFCNLPSGNQDASDELDPRSRVHFKHVPFFRPTALSDHGCAAPPELTGVSVSGISLVSADQLPGPKVGCTLAVVAGSTCYESRIGCVDILWWDRRGFYLGAIRGGAEFHLMNQGSRLIVLCSSKFACALGVVLSM